ncbi:MAG: nucleotide exchange factor GrpE [Bacteroidetes bacterium]|nr:nucleotide exchange factor GrpE [Bacteroidota bacterium]MBS1738994.1 nucleotide exchange factor GrpE [Bacteroidota bacterium]
MFFKKRNTMTEQNLDKEPTVSQQSDNFTENVAQEEELARALNTDDSIPGNQLLNEEPGNESELEKVKAELAEMKDKYLRLMAEFDNFRRRTAKERIELSQTAGKEIVESLLVVLDDADRATKQMEASNDTVQIKEGITLVFNKLHTILQHKGLKKMESVKQPFDADLHEAITEIPTGDETLTGKVVDEIQPGYYLNDRLIRHAKVVVGK